MIFINICRTCENTKYISADVMIFICPTCIYKNLHVYISYVLHQSTRILYVSILLVYILYVLHKCSRICICIYHISNQRLFSKNNTVQNTIFGIQFIYENFVCVYFSCLYFVCPICIY